MHVVKLKYKKSLESCYANTSVVHSVKDIRDEDSNYHLQHFFMSLKEAKKLMFELVMRNNNSNDYWVDDDRKLEYISIVECSHYEPYKEFQVIDYKEFL